MLTLLKGDKLCNFLTIQFFCSKILKKGVALWFTIHMFSRQHIEFTRSVKQPLYVVCETFVCYFNANKSLFLYL